ncbi:adenylate/guanylate cyclase domain-containing protein [Algibacillus agarilyticus]|uniref:adenylate/guanylate cyclase domain-containing protein n=1 Tax=Algibacillus agarilyticus TaxID=2234133 RepID=UPI000DCFEC8E|nr:adenylate/guanylate cyclase domain-containing protein [Algibacillus agarilyticus]
MTGGAAGASFYYGSAQIVLEYSDNNSKHITDKVINQTTHYLNTPAEQGKVISQLITEAPIIDAHENIWRYMWQQMQVLPQVQSIHVADEEGSYVQVRRDPQLATRYIDRSTTKLNELWVYRDAEYNRLNSEEKKPTFDPRNRPWYMNTLIEQKTYWTDVYLFTTAQTPGISATFPLLDSDDNKRGVIGINIPLESLSVFLSELNLDKKGHVFITNANHEIIAFPDTNLITTLLPDSGLRRVALVYELPQKWLRNAYDHYRETGETKFFSETDDKTYIINVAPFPKSFPTKWQVFVVMPEKEVLGSVNQVLLQTLLIFLSIFALSLLVILFFSQRITKPIKALTIETEKIRNFNLDDIQRVRTNISEIHSMSNAIISAKTGLQSFRKYVPEVLVKQLIDLGEQAKIGGQETEVTIFFSDIANFTSIAERIHPQDLMLHLSEYFEELSMIIVKNNGTIDKYIGDAIMAFWGAPIHHERTPYDACKSALLCQKRNKLLNEQWIKDRKPVLKTRIGLHTGRTIVGNVGSSVRINYSVLGDSVNLAARLEGINKLYDTEIIISENTYHLVKDSYKCRMLDIVAVKGKQIGVQIYELLHEIDEQEPELKYPIEFYETYELALKDYLNKNISSAMDKLYICQEIAQHDKSVLKLLASCKQFIEKGDTIPEHWDGITTLHEK